ncbi:hypothetical protein OG21DRAFT_1490316 [Imleria badia]|nr:hypothetical protein OG21DRAFT_1490316 [Imleria badia]
MFIAGLLLMKVKINQAIHVPAPLPHQIILHAASMVDPPFMKAMYKNYNQLFWNSGDRVRTSDSTHLGKYGNLVSIDRETCSAVVQFSEGSEYPISLTLLSCLYRIGDAVRVIEDLFSDRQSAHHESEITVTNGDIKFQAPQHLLKFYLPDQQILAPVGVLNPSPVDSSVEQVEVGDTVRVTSGPLASKIGFVLSVKRLASTLTFYSIHSDDLHHKYEISITSVTFLPDAHGLKFTHEWGYNVREGDGVIVVRGDHRGKSGTVSRVHLEERVLDITSLTELDFLLPISHFAHAIPVRDCDENECYLSKDVLVVSGNFHGWRGTLVSVENGKKCVVVQGAFSTLETVPMDNVVIQ